MTSRQLLSSAARDVVVRTVREVEASTSAEVVVVVRAASGNYLAIDMLIGCLLAFAWLLVFLFHPRPFDDDLVPFQVLGLFLLGTVATSKLAPLRRLVVQKRWREESVERAARAAFVENGVFRTRDRTGLLVYISLFEQRACLVGDVAIESADLKAALSDAQKNIEMAIVAPDAPAALTNALKKLGEALAPVLPRSENDVNELSDEVAA